MTPAQLRETKGFVEMCQSVPFQLLMSHFEQTCPFLGKDIPDPTSIVRNEGKLQGWFELIRQARNIHAAPPAPSKPSAEPARLYPDAPTPNVKHNRPPKS
jgi:hypothetical protein